MKDSKKKLSPMEQDAKLSVLKAIMGDMDSVMCDDLDSKKKMKVSVISDSKQGIEKGLNQAEDIVQADESGMTIPKFGSAQDPGALMTEEDYEDDSSEEPELEDEHLSSDELDKKIKKLIALKEQKSVKLPF